MKHFMALLIFFIGVSCATAPPRLNEPIPLRLGETREVGPDGFEITLRSLSEDSGCFSPSDCSIMLFKGSLAVRLKDKKNLIQVNASLKPGQAVSLDIDGYQFQLTGIRQVGQTLEATFVILGPKKDGPTQSPQ